MVAPNKKREVIDRRQQRMGVILYHRPENSHYPGGSTVTEQSRSKVRIATHPIKIYDEETTGLKTEPISAALKLERFSTFSK